MEYSREKEGKNNTQAHKTRLNKSALLKYFPLLSKIIQNKNKNVFLNRYLNNHIKSNNVVIIHNLDKEIHRAITTLTHP